MKFIDRIILLLVLISLLGFSYVVTDNETNEFAKSKINLSTSNQKQEQQFSQMIPVITYKPLGLMRASWYGPGFHGKMTANGEIYNQYELTAAHKSLKFGTLLRLTNLENNRSIIVRINDRGPYINGRDLDLSFGAAKALGIIKPGIRNLKVELVQITDSIQIVENKSPF
ncbi:MAG: septal ring lytic transglycosylase RlpA family protein [Ignavibacteria bacterium]|nr:septal ring lytic transglycosylase RlpA family protein [Ignavibacteria bacterium]